MAETYAYQLSIFAGIRILMYQNQCPALYTRALFGPSDSQVSDILLDCEGLSLENGKADVETETLDHSAWSSCTRSTEQSGHRTVSLAGVAVASCHPLYRTHCRQSVLSTG